MPWVHEISISAQSGWHAVHTPDATRTKFEPARNRPLSGLVTGRWLGYRAATPVMIDERHGVAAWGGGKGG
jgi:hypothetical protein